MPYIGKEPAVGNFVKLDAISTSSTNTYNLTLDSVAFTPESANHMLVSLNGVIQAPQTSFSVSGSTITFLPSSGTLSSSDSIDFIMVYGNVLDIGTPSDSTVTNAKTNFVSTSSTAGLQIKGDNTTGGTLQLNCEQNSHGIKLRSPAHSAGQSYTLTFPTGNVTADRFLKVDSVSGSGATGIGQLSFAEAGGNTPGFQAYASSPQTGVSDSTWTKVNLDTEIYDSDNKFSTTSSRFTPTVAGYYHCFGSVYIDGATDNIQDHAISIYKNGARFLDHTWDDGGDEIVRQNLYVVGTIYLDADDYIELYAFVDVASGTATFDASSRLETHMGAFKVA